MGADLTIIADGTYFRDPYNAHNSWWPIGLSYWPIWHFCKDKGLVNEDELNILPEGVKFIAKLVAKHPLTEKALQEHFEAHKNDLAEGNFDSWKKHWKERDAEMRAFWKKAVKLKSEVHFWV
jgi:hypothetical protein